MRIKQIIILCLLVSTVILTNSCNKKDTSTPADPCAGVRFGISQTHTESVGTSNNGTITILAPRGDTISYKLNSGSYQNSWYFTNLAPGNYVVTLKNQNGCTDTAQITILNYGPKYALVKQLVLGYCSPCHLNGGMAGGKNFDTDNSIVSSSVRIKARAADGIPSFMPPAPNSPLTNVDKQKILDWITAGGTTSD